MKLGSCRSLKHVSLNKNKFCPYNLMKILLSFLINVLDSGWNWWMNLPKLSLICCDRDNFGKFIQQFQPETKTFIRKLERILIKLYRQNLSLLFNETCLYIYIYIYIYIVT